MTGEHDVAIARLRRLVTAPTTRVHAVRADVVALLAAYDATPHPVYLSVAAGGEPDASASGTGSPSGVPGAQLETPTGDGVAAATPSSTHPPP